jgi:hypothetical protein
MPVCHKGSHRTVAKKSKKGKLLNRENSSKEIQGRKAIEDF